MKRKNIKPCKKCAYFRTQYCLEFTRKEREGMIISEDYDCWSSRLFNALKDKVYDKSK